MTMVLTSVSYDHRSLESDTLASLLQPLTRARLVSFAAGSPLFAECVVVATCLRFEVYAITEDPERCRVALAERILDLAGIADEPRLLREDDAVRHLLRVTGGLESILPGEAAAQGQVRAAYREAVDRSLCGPWLHRLFHQAFRTARRLRNEALVLPAVASLPARSVKQMVDRLGPSARILVVGTGQAGRAALREARERGVTRLFVSGADPRAIAAEHGATPCDPGDVMRLLAEEIDGLIAVSGRGLLLHAEALRAVTRTRPLLVHDLGVPPNLEALGLPDWIERRALRDLAADQPPLRGGDVDRVIDEMTRQYMIWRRSRGGVDVTRAAGRGRVALVGAGPGDPELLTLRALRLLESADIVFHDALLPPALLARIPRGVRRVPVGRRVGAVIASEAEIIQGLAAWALRGAAVVRLKGGDPSVFGRAGEETRTLEALGIEVEVVPGVTAATAAAAALKIPLTERGVAGSALLVTFHPREDDPDPAARDARFIRQAREAETLAIYMGAGRLRALALALRAAGRSPEEKLAIVERASHPGERARIFRLGDLESGSLPEVDTPALILVGPTVSAGRGEESRENCLDQEGLPA